MREVTVCATQMCCCPDREENIQRASDLVRAAREKEGAQIVLLQELFATRYFPQELREDHLDAAEAYEGSALLDRMAELAGDLGVVLPVSFFERSGNCCFNSVCVVDADGTKLGVYRKSHIPMGPGYEEKYYFAPGDTGFKVFQTRHAKVGVGICWDQWFPECARAMALDGAEVLLYPTAIGSEPHCPGLDSWPHWSAVMKGHAAANLVPVVASNRVGVESCEHYNGGRTSLKFYGGSFVADHMGQEVASCSRIDGESVGEWEIASFTFDLDEVARQRRAWGLFRDRRPDLYGRLLSM